MNAASMMKAGEAVLPPAAAAGSVAWAFMQLERSVCWSGLVLLVGSAAFVGLGDPFWVVLAYAGALALGLCLGRAPGVERKQVLWRRLSEAASVWMSVRPAILIGLVMFVLASVGQLLQGAVEATEVAIGQGAAAGGLWATMLASTVGGLETLFLGTALAGLGAALLSGFADGMWAGSLTRRAGVPVWKAVPFLNLGRERLGEGMNGEMKSRDMWLRGPAHSP